MRAFFCSEDGSALVEVALALPMMALLVAGAINYGIFVQRKMQVTVSASAAAAFAAYPGNQSNTSGMSNAAKAASPSLTGMTVASQLLYTCSVGGILSTTIPTCSGDPTYNFVHQYVQVQTSVTVPIVIGIAGLPSSITLRGQAISRVLY